MSNEALFVGVLVLGALAWLLKSPDEPEKPQSFKRSKKRGF